MEIRKLHKNEISDFRDLIDIFKDVFESDTIPGEDHLSSLLSNEDFWVFVIRTNNKVVGGLTIYVLHSYYGTKPVAYIYDVAVMPEFQGRGFGKKLIEEVCKYCKENGFKEAYVEAEAEDTDAVNFYRKTSFSSEMKAIHFTDSF